MDILPKILENSWVRLRYRIIIYSFVIKSILTFIDGSCSLDINTSE